MMVGWLDLILRAMKPAIRLPLTKKHLSMRNKKVSLVPRMLVKPVAHQVFGMFYIIFIQVESAMVYAVPKTHGFLHIFEKKIFTWKYVPVAIFELMFIHPMLHM